MKNNYPLLYSYLNCPYCIRARYALLYAGIKFTLCEVDLQNKPQELLEKSPKGTVPVLVLPDNIVIDQSLDIMFWALQQADPKKWLPTRIEDLADAKEIIHLSDAQFAPTLRLYKSLDQNAVITREEIRAKITPFMENIEILLQGNKYLQGDNKTIADVGVFPFFRLLALKDAQWFAESKFINIKQWVERLSTTDIFVKLRNKQ